LDQWAKTWLVDFNPKKTKALIISNNTNIPELNIRFNDEPVELVDNHKHLAVTFVSLFISICIKSKFFPEYDNEVSSANSLAKLPKLSVMSLIYNKNNKGPSTDPWGTKRITTSHLKSLNTKTTMTHSVRNPGSGRSNAN
jgi:hypothetical protein